jgi:hypothetical protein
MHYQPANAITERPPPDALAELDAAAHALTSLSRRDARLTVGLDEQARALRIELDEGAGPKALSPTQLFALLNPS